MNRQFTAEEWTQIRSKEDVHLQPSNFFRFLTLKESFVKGLGQDLSCSLERLSFTIHQELKVQKVIHDSELYIDREGQAQNWHFEESLLDLQYCVCTAICTGFYDETRNVFAFVTPQTLLQTFDIQNTGTDF